MKQWTFTTILYVDHDAAFEAALTKLKANDGFDKEVQLLVMDPHASEEVAHLCQGQANVRYCPMEDAEIGAAYNEGLRQAEGTYVNFCLATAEYSGNIYKKVSGLFRRQPAHMLSCQPALRNELGELVPYGGSSQPKEADPVERLDLTPNRLQLNLNAYFFQRAILEGRSFNEALHEDALPDFLLRLQLEHPQYCLAHSLHYYYTVSLEDNTSTNPLQYQRWWYDDSITNFMLPLLEHAQAAYENVPRFLQYACYYLIYSKYNCNLNDRTKGILKEKDEVLHFVNVTGQALRYVDNGVIMNRTITSYASANRALRLLLLRAKTDAMGMTWNIIDDGNNYLAIMHPKSGTGSVADTDQVAVLASSSRELLRIRLINYYDGMLHIDANAGMADWLERDQFKAYAVCTAGKDVTTYPAEELEVYPLVKCLGFTFQHKCPFQFHIPVERSKPNQSLQFFYEFQGRRYQFNLTFDTPNSRMMADNPYAYWMFRDNWMLSKLGRSKLAIRKVDRKFHRKRELLFWNAARKKDPAGLKHALAGFWLRLRYWKKKPAYSKRHIWVTFDKLYKAGDNGEYMYQYCRKHQKDVEIYYIVRKESPDYERLVREDKKHILVYGTMRCQLICLLAEALLATHANITAQFDPMASFRPYNKDLMRGDVICIQHGLTIQKIAQYQNRQFDNTHLYCCASPFELENLSHPIYGYDPSVLKMTGLARYDGLRSNEQKLILITPTWRRNVVNSSIANIKKTHNENFKNSTYYQIYNTLINDQRLIDCAKRTGYRITYLLHPAMSAQLEDFDRNDYVELIPATGDMSYEKILTESSLMVTDYSGVQFDFAYQRKPLVYYHPDALPPHYEEGGLIYDTMGFGPICKNNDEIVSTLCEYMENGCKMLPEYVKRADNFFAFDDFNNCQRIYHAIQEMLQGKSKK